MKQIDNHSNTRGVYPLTEEVVEKLNEKHPPEQDPDPEILLVQTQRRPEPVIYEEIDSDLVQKIMMKIQGSGGPTCRCRLL